MRLFHSPKAVKVPDLYMPEGVYFLITHKSAVIFPNKIKTMRVLTEVQGIDGSVLEGRNYFDAFVLGAKSDGVYAAVDPAKVLDAPVVTRADNDCEIDAEAGVVYKYTTDGSDPRYSKNAKIYTGEVTVEDGEIFRASGEAEGKFPSAVAEA